MLDYVRDMMFSNWLIREQSILVRFDKRQPVNTFLLVLCGSTQVAYVIAYGIFLRTEKI